MCLNTGLHYVVYNVHSPFPFEGCMNISSDLLQSSEHTNHCNKSLAAVCPTGLGGMRLGAQLSPYTTQPFLEYNRERFVSFYMREERMDELSALAHWKKCKNNSAVFREIRGGVLHLAVEGCCLSIARQIHV